MTPKGRASLFVFLPGSNLIYIFIMEDKNKKQDLVPTVAQDIKYVVMPQEFRKTAGKKFLSPKILIIGSAVLGALVLSVAAVLIYMKATAPAPRSLGEVGPPASVTPPTEAIPPPAPAPTTTPEQPSLLSPLTPTTTPKTAVPEIPVVGQLTAGSDADADGLSDHEEVAFQTDPTRPDTDGDGFLDGNEVFNLYNPAAPPPVTLLESGIVKLYRNASFGYTIYYPTLWSTSSTIDGSRVSFKAQAPDADSINVTVVETGADVSLRSWYLSQYPQADINALQSYASKQGYQGLQDGERLNTYIKKDKKVFIINYDLGGSDKTVVWYRALYGMMLNSLKIE